MSSIISAIFKSGAQVIVTSKIASVSLGARSITVQVKWPRPRPVLARARAWHSDRELICAHNVGF